MKPNLRSIPLHMMLLAGLLPCAPVKAGDAASPAAPPPAIETAAAPLAFLGVDTVPVDAATRKRLKLADETGLRIFVVSPSSPAHKSLQAGDVLCEMDSQILCNHAQLRALVRGKKPGDSIKLKIFRDGEAMEIAVKLAALPAAVCVPPCGKTGINGGTLRRPPGHVDAGEHFRQLHNEHLRRLHALNPHLLPPGADAIERLLNGGCFTDGDVGTFSELLKRHREMLDRMEMLEAVPSASQAPLKKNTPAENDVSAPGDNGDKPAHTSSTTATVHDNDGTATLAINNGRHVLKIQDVQGRITFEGPVDTAAQRNALPAEVAKKLQSLEQLLGKEITSDEAQDEDTTREPDRTKML